MLLDASSGEITLVVAILLLVLIAPKVPRIGERIGVLLAGRRTRAPRRGKRPPRAAADR